MKIKIIEFNKPTHQTNGRYWVNLQKEKLEKSRKNNEWIVLHLPNGYTKPQDPGRILKYGIKTEAIYLYPNNPMQLVGCYWELLPPHQQEQARHDPYFWTQL